MANRFDSPNAERDAWLASYTEDILDPDLPIIDAHHHLWIRNEVPYLLREFADDLNAGHNVIGTVFAECHSMYRTSGPEEEKSIGEMEFIAGVSAMSDSGAFNTQAVCRTGIGNVDLTLGDGAKPILEALTEASGYRFRGVRASICWHEDQRLHNAAPFEHYLRNDQVRLAIAALSGLGHSLDIWGYHTQLDEVIEICDAFPDLRVILNHTGTPILGGPYRDQLDDVKAEWLKGMTALSERDNVYLKLGALPAKFEHNDPDAPPTSEAVAHAWQPWIEPCIEAFGSDRCFFESNFPVHKNWVSYPVLWNAFKRIAAGATAEEKADLFERSAKRAYRWPE